MTTKYFKNRRVVAAALMLLERVQGVTTAAAPPVGAAAREASGADAPSDADAARLRARALLLKMAGGEHPQGKLGGELRLVRCAVLQVVGLWSKTPPEGGPTMARPSTSFLATYRWGRSSTWAPMGVG